MSLLGQEWREKTKKKAKERALIECLLARSLVVPLSRSTSSVTKKNARQALPRADREKCSRAGLRRNRVLRAPRRGARRERRNNPDLDLLFNNSDSARRRRGVGALRLDPAAPRPLLGPRRALQRARLEGFRPLCRPRGQEGAEGVYSRSGGIGIDSDPGASRCGARWTARRRPRPRPHGRPRRHFLMH